MTGEQNNEVLDILAGKCSKVEAKMLSLGKNFTVEVKRQNLDGQDFTFKFAGRNLDLFIPLLGDVQIQNAAVAVMAVLVLQDKGFKITADLIKAGLKSTKCPEYAFLLFKQSFCVSF